MQKTFSACAVVALATFGAGAQAQEITARVISATPIVQQVPCNNQPIAVPPPATGGGALLGAITGGLLGSLVGGGTGTVIATGLGIVTGAAVGDRIERSGPPMLIAQGCANQYGENRTVGYNVTYEYGGNQHTVQMANDPGPTVRLQLAPAGAITQPNGYQPDTYRQPYVNAQPQVYPPSAAYPSGSGEVTAAPGAGAVSTGPNVVYPAYPAYPAYAAPAYRYPVYPAPYYSGYSPGYYVAPIALSLGFGYSNWGYRGHGHRHYGGHGHRGGHRR